VAVSPTERFVPGAVVPELSVAVLVVVEVEVPVETELVVACA
jgi:hypothetical protein